MITTDKIMKAINLGNSWWFYLYNTKLPSSHLNDLLQLYIVILYNWNVWTYVKLTLLSDIKISFVIRDYAIPYSLKQNRPIRYGYLTWMGLVYRQLHFWKQEITEQTCCYLSWFWTTTAFWMSLCSSDEWY